MVVSVKESTYFKNVLRHFLDDRLKLFCSKFALNWTNIKELKKERFREVPIDHPVPQCFSLQEGPTLWE